MNKKIPHTQRGRETLQRLKLLAKAKEGTKTGMKDTKKEKKTYNTNGSVHKQQTQQQQQQQKFDIQ